MKLKRKCGFLKRKDANLMIVILCRWGEVCCRGSSGNPGQGSGSPISTGATFGDGEGNVGRVLETLE